MSRRRSKSDDDFDPYHKWLGIPEGKRPPTHYQLLGISPDEEDADVIESAAQRQSSHIKQFEGTHSRTVSSLLYQIDEAKITILTPELRDAYDERMEIRRKYRRTNQGAGAAYFGSGSHSLGEHRSFVKEYAGIVSVLTVSFFLMAVASFYYLPWQKMFDGKLDQRDVPPPVAQIAKPVPVPPKIAEQEVKKIPDDKSPPKDNLPLEESALGKWVDLINEKLIDTTTCRGFWSFSGNQLEIKGGDRTFSALNYPVNLPDDYELDLVWNRFRENENFNKGTPFSLPVGSSRIRLAFYHDWIQLSVVRNERDRLSGPVLGNGKGVEILSDGREIGRYSFDGGYGIGSYANGDKINIPVNTQVVANIKVNIEVEKARIKVFLNGREALSWEGLIANLSEDREEDFYDGQSRQGIFIGTYQKIDVRFEKLRLRGKGAEKLADSVKRQPPRQIVNDAQRQAGSWVLKVGGGLEILVQHPNDTLSHKITIPNGGRLPDDLFQITKVDLRKTSFDESQLGQFRNLSTLVELNLMESKISDDALRYVGEIRSLRKLNVAATKVNGKGFRFLGGLNDLQSLLCGGSPIRDESMPHLISLSQLSELGLIDTQIGDEGLFQLSKLKTLNELRLNGTKVTDAGIRALLKLKQLRKLEIRNTKVSKSVIVAFRKAVPGCEVIK